MHFAKPKGFLVVVVLLSTLAVSPENSSADDTILVDVEKGVIDGINFLAGLEKTIALVGEANVSTESWPVSGGPITVHALRIKGHTIYAYYDGDWLDITIVDRAFITKEGLRVGSKVGDFNRVYKDKERITKTLYESISYTLQPNKRILGIGFDLSKLPFDQIVSMKEDDPVLQDSPVTEITLRYIGQLTPN